MKRLKDASGPGYCKYYVPTPFALETTLDRSNESPGSRITRKMIGVRTLFL